MTKLLEKAFEMASELPDVEQNMLGKWLLEELENDRKWEQLFSGSEDILDQLADEALESHKEGKIRPMDIKQL